MDRASISSSRVEPQVLPHPQLCVCVSSSSCCLPPRLTSSRCLCTMSSSPESDSELDSWLSVMSSKFRSMTLSQQSSTLDTFLSCMDAHDRWLWHQRCFTRLHGDPVAALPSEVTHHLLSLLDPVDLYSAAKVCRAWRRAVNEDLALWRRTAAALGAKVHQQEGQHGAESYRRAALWCLHHRQRLRNGKALTVRPLRRSLLPSANITAMDYCNHKVAIAASDEDNDCSMVAVWCSMEHRLLAKFRVARQLTSGIRVTVVRLLGNNTVCLGYIEGGLYFCNVQVDEHDDEEVQVGSNFTAIPHAHDTSIFSIDGAESGEFVATGSADSTARLWCPRSPSGGGGPAPRPLKTLTSQSDWVVTVKVREKTGSSSSWILATMSKKEIHIFVFSDLDTFCNESDTLTTPKCVVPLKNAEVYEELREMFFTPGLHLSDDEITFVRQMPIFDTQTIGDADIVCVDILTGKLVRTVHVNQKIRKLLAVGKNFALALLPYVDTKYKNLAVIDLCQKKIVGGCTVPHSRATSPDFSQMFVGDKSWLDGLDRRQVTQSALVAGLLVHNGHAYLVEWK